jgi:hypothetical protein
LAVEPMANPLATTTPDEGDYHHFDLVKRFIFEVGLVQ